jgi:hypothetical protein
MKEAILSAARADAVPEAVAGLWTVKKFTFATAFDVPREPGKVVTIPAGNYTQLYRMTMDKLHSPYGDLVMQDTPDELVTHLDFMLRAHGHVLVTGLGLGCVVRGCLANPRVRAVTVVERDQDVIRLVWPVLQREAGNRVYLVHADALEWVREACLVGFDCAWHDLWSDPDKEEQALQVSHGQLILHLRDQVPLQGAWQFPKILKRSFRETLSRSGATVI